MNLRETLLRYFKEKLYSEDRLTPPIMKWKTIRVGEYEKIYRESVENPVRFWEIQATLLKWHRTWSSVIDGSPPRVKWFRDGLINAYHNIMGKHRESWIWSKPALIWEGEEGDSRIVSYSELGELVEKIAGSMYSFNVKPGDWVLIYSPPLIESIAVSLAAVKIGVPFEHVFTGFNYWELSRRITRRSPRLIFTSSGFYRRGRLIDTLDTLRKAIDKTGYRGVVVVFERTGLRPLREGELSFSDFIHYSSRRIGDYIAESDHPLFGLHSGYRDDYKPITHPTGGFLVQVYATSRWIGLRPHDTYYCTVWPGWITGISYLIFGPLMIGSTILIYDGAIDYPSWDRWWGLIEDYAVTLFLTTSGALRLLSRQTSDTVSRRNLDTLRAILVTAEPLELDTWWWTYRVIGTGNTPFIDSSPGRLSGRIPVVNMYIQSEVGSFITGNLVNYTFTPITPGSTGTPIPGFHVAILGEDNVVREEGFGEVVLLNPWPSSPIEYPDEYIEAWSRGFYETRDYGYFTRDRYLYVMGRVDGVLKVSGYRLSPGAVEKALLETLRVESTVLTCLDETRFNGIIILYSGEVSEQEVFNTVRKTIGAISEPVIVKKTGIENIYRFKETKPGLMIEKCDKTPF